MNETIADILPVKARRIIYVIVPVFVILEAIWDFLPNGYEDKVLASLTALGFTLALSQAKDTNRRIVGD